MRRLLKRLGANTPTAVPASGVRGAAGGPRSTSAPTPILTPDGKRRKTHVFRIVLSHSRKAYSEACFRQTTDDFTRLFGECLLVLRRRPPPLVIDNLKAAVTRADWFDPGTEPQAAIVRPALRHGDPPHEALYAAARGKIERGIGYVKNNGEGRTFAALARENRHLAHWEATVADTRIHRTTKRQVGRVFTGGRTGPLCCRCPASGSLRFKKALREVHRDGYVEVDKSYYSAPPEYVGRHVWARWDGRLVRLFNQRFEQIAMRCPLNFAGAIQHSIAAYRGREDQQAGARGRRIC